MVESVHSSEQLRFVAAATEAPSESARRFAADHGVRLLADLEAVLADREVDAVVLATPHSQHVEQIIAAARAGKAVYCEKPLALRLADAERALEACREAGVVFGLGNDKRFFAAMRALSEIAGGGELGELVHLEGQYSNPFSSMGLSGAWRKDPGETLGGGGLSGPALHAVDALISMAGPVAEVDARLHVHQESPWPVDALAALLVFQSGATGTIGSVRAVPEFFRAHVFGTRGWAEVSGFETLTVHLLDQEPQRRLLPGELAVGYLLERFAIAAAGGEDFPVSQASMLDTMAAFEATAASLAQRRSVRVTRPNVRSAVA